LKQRTADNEPGGSGGAGLLDLLRDLLGASTSAEQRPGDLGPARSSIASQAFSEPGYWTLRMSGPSFANRRAPLTMMSDSLAGESAGSG